MKVADVRLSYLVKCKAQMHSKAKFTKDSVKVYERA